MRKVYDVRIVASFHTDDPRWINRWHDFVKAQLDSAWLVVFEAGTEPKGKR